MMWESYGSLAGVVLTAIGLFFTARHTIRTDKATKEKDAQALLDSKLKEAKEPLERRIQELETDHAQELQEHKDRVTQLQNDQDRVISNAVEFWKTQAEANRKDSEYWRSRAEGK